jgi:hypothetical protein
MKRLVNMPMLFLLAMLCGCAQTGWQSKEQNPQVGKALDSSVSVQSVAGIPLRNGVANAPMKPLDREAAKQALDRWQPTKIGRSHYVYMITSKPDNTDTERIIYEMRNVRIQILPEKISDADKLNGTEWKGQILLRADALRSYSPQRGKDASGSIQQPDTTWSPWSDSEFVVQVERTHDKWNVEELSPQTRLIKFKQTEASDLPK